MFGLYIHIPFCLEKCAYCDFNSRTPQVGEVERYLSALQKEIASIPALAGRDLATLYIGGGTPTLLAGDQFARLFACLRATFAFAGEMEITVEANPGTIDRAKAEELRDLGVNRISLGVQSLQDRVLARLGRIHSAADALAAMEILRNTGFDNISADLIYGVPGQTVADWVEDLKRLMQFRPEHLSLYALSVEVGTPFAQQEEEGRLSLPAEEEGIEMFRRAVEMTWDAGYEHYEISNYALPGHESCHNTRYWTMEEYYGAGSGAHSFLRRLQPVRFHNDPAPSDYIRKVERGESPVVEREILSRKTFLSEAMMLGLRRRGGVKVEEFQKAYDVDPRKHFAGGLARTFRENWIEEKDGFLRLTLEGVLFSNEVFVDLF